MYEYRENPNGMNTLLIGLGVVAVAGGVYYLWLQQQSGKEAVKALTDAVNGQNGNGQNGNGTEAFPTYVPSNGGEEGLPGASMRGMTPENQATAKEAAIVAKGQGSSGRYSKVGMKFGPEATLVILTDSASGDRYRVKVFKDGSPALFLSRVPASAAA